MGKVTATRLPHAAGDASRNIKVVMKQVLGEERPWAIGIFFMK